MDYLSCLQPQTLEVGGDEGLAGQKTYEAVEPTEGGRDMLGDVDIADHALIRYVERVKGLSLDCFRRPRDTDRQLIDRVERVNGVSLQKCRGEIRSLVAASALRRAPFRFEDGGIGIVVECLKAPPLVVTVLADGIPLWNRKCDWHQRIVYVAPEVAATLRAA